MATAINEHLNRVPSLTVVNAAVNSGVLQNGSVLGKYTIIERISNSGEANIYLCEYESQKVVAKVYKRTDAIKNDVIDKLSNINSPYIAKVIEVFLYEGYQVEILPYYVNGNLENKTYSFTELKEKIIPALNEGLHILHENSIVHKDLKPSNIMISNDGSTVSIIDFGISSVLSEGVSMIITQTGVTFDYAAPEIFPPRYNCWNGVDYYSFGLIIYKLFYGRLPFEEINTEERERYFISHKLPFPEPIPKDLKDLIEGLTYLDIRNQKDLKNPNRRWTYNEVTNWCKGIKQTVPGSGETVEYGFKPITLGGKTYNDKKSYVIALLNDWEFGKEKLYRGDLANMFSKSDDDMLKICIQAEKSVEDEEENILFLKTMLKLECSINQIYWKGKCYENIIDMGTQFLEDLQCGNNKMTEMINLMLQYNFFSFYIGLKSPDSREEIDVMKKIESAYKVSKINPEREHYMLAYALAEYKNFVIDGNKFDSVTKLETYLKEQLRISVSAFEKACKKMVKDDGQLTTAYETWLIALGKRNDINKWLNEKNRS